MGDTCQGPLGRQESMCLTLLSPPRLHFPSRTPVGGAWRQSVRLRPHSPGITCLCSSCKTTAPNTGTEEPGDKQRVLFSSQGRGRGGCLCGRRGQLELGGIPLEGVGSRFEIITFHTGEIGWTPGMGRGRCVGPGFLLLSSPGWWEVIFG